MSNEITYLIMAGIFGFLWFLETALIIMLAKKTHALIEFKSWLRGLPLCLFFDDAGHVDWKPRKVDTNIIEDKEYGSFIVGKTYIDKLTNNQLMIFDSKLGVGISVKAAKIAEDLKQIVTSNEQLMLLKQGIAKNEIPESETINSIKTSIDISALKYMMNSIMPHSISEKISKAIARNSRNFGQVNTMQILIMFAGILGAIVAGYILIKSVGV